MRALAGVLSVVAILAGCAGGVSAPDVASGKRPEATADASRTTGGKPAESKPRPADRFEVPSGMANLFVLHLAGSKHRQANFPVVVDGVQRGPLPEGKYFKLTLPPGSRSVVSSSDENQQLVKVNLLAGQNHFVRIAAKSGWNSPQVVVDELPSDVGRKVVLEATEARP